MPSLIYDQGKHSELPNALRSTGVDSKILPTCILELNATELMINLVANDHSFK